MEYQITWTVFKSAKEAQRAKKTPKEMMRVDSETLFKHKENAKAFLNVWSRTRLTFVTAANNI